MATRGSATGGGARERILLEATRLFASRGYEGVSLQALADAVGMRKPSLLHHFTSKGAIREQVVSDWLDHFREEIPRRMAEARGGLGRFAAAVTALVDYFGEDPDRARLVLREVLDRPEVTRERLLAALSPWVHLVTDAIRLGQSVGRIRSDVDPEAYLLEVVVMVLGTVASVDVTGALLGRGGDPNMQRRLDELIRMARTALFVDEEPHTGP